MRRTWPLLIWLGVIGAIAGTAVAGGQEAKESVVVLTPTTIPTYITVPAGPVVTLQPDDTIDIPVEPGAPPISLDLPAESTTTVTSTTIDLASQGPVPTSPPTTTTPPVASTIAPPAAEAPPVTDDIPIIPDQPATTVIVEPTERTNLRVVIANANGQRDAPRVGYKLYKIGYETVVIGETTGVLDQTTIYYRDGFQPAAVMVAQDMGGPTAMLMPMPATDSTPFSDSDDQGDVIVLLGNDAIIPDA